MLMNATEENNITTIKFYRMRNTTDLQNDTAIPVRLFVTMFLKKVKMVLTVS